jgi:hypothetical protein
MLLRASGEREDTEYNLSAVTSSDQDAGVAHGDWLRSLTEAAISRDWESLAPCLEAASIAMGHQQAVDALVVAAAFNGITRVADATGIPLDDNTADTTVDLRAGVGIDAFDYAEKTRRLG